MPPLVPFALFFLTSASPGLEALKSSAARFHERETAAERPGRGANSDLLAAATGFQHDLRDWLALQLPEARKGMPGLYAAGILGVSKGKADSVEIGRPAAFAESVLIRIGLHIPGGIDSAAWLYEKRDGKWVRTLSLERSQQRNASTLGRVVFSPADASGTHLMLAYRIPVSDSGCWHPVSFQLYRVGTPTPPPLLMDDWHPANLCDGAPDAKIDSSGFTLELQDRDLTPGATRTHILHYQLTAEKPRRVPPVALSPRQFVHEWIESDWTQAIDWTEPGARPALQKLHDELRGSGPPVSGEYRSAAACTTAHRWAIALDIGKHGTHRFIVGEPKPGELTVLAADEGAAQACGTPAPRRP